MFFVGWYVFRFLPRWLIALIRAFPPANLTSTNAALGSTLTVRVDKTIIANHTGIYCAFASGMQTAFPTYNNGLCTRPAQYATGGQVYGLITNAMNISDSRLWLVLSFTLDIDKTNSEFPFLPDCFEASCSDTVSGTETEDDESVEAKSAGTRSVAGDVAAVLVLAVAVLV